ncbi:MAG: hypothetical protein GXP63_05925 [DPANN group archaeon]|nr:hypothetical protein [DPANN group archaeon]
MEYFYDTYILIEMTKRKKELQEYVDKTAYTLDYNLAELFYYFLREYNERTSWHVFRVFEKMAMRIPLSLIGKAMAFRWKYRKKRFSYVDALGYLYALENDLIFVTGDRAFNGMKQVEIVR